MALFDIDDPNIDTAELEKRVNAAIEAKRGVRFTDDELEELRSAELKPRMRREDLPRGFVDELAEARSKLPEVGAPPGGDPSYDVVAELYATGAGGPKGAILKLIRAIARPFYGATTNLPSVLGHMRGELSDQASWTGQRFSDMTAQLDRWRDRDLHLMHNLVREITALRLQQVHMQDRINELIRELDALKQRERALESLTVKKPGESADQRS